MSLSLVDKKKKLYDIVGRETRAAVACSGGVDSTLLLKVVHDVLGHENTMAVFADTPLLPQGESESINKITGAIGSRLLVVDLNPLDWPEFTTNPRDRCYLCKKKIYKSFLEKLADIKFDVLMDGTNLDDLDEFRPGLKALEELNIKTPLAEAGLTKSEIRQLSRDLGLPNWDKHSSSCLATRIQTDQHITLEKMDLITKCEGVLHDLGFRGCRVRLSGDTATVEVLEKDIEHFVQKQIRWTFVEKCNDYGIKRICLNMEGRKDIFS